MSPPEAQNMHDYQETTTPKSMAHSTASLQHLDSLEVPRLSLETAQKCSMQDLAKSIAVRKERRLGTSMETEVVLKNLSYLKKAMKDDQLEKFSGVTPRSSEDPYILKNVNAVFPPGTMTLVLGPPGCGKTTLLKLIAQLIPHRKFSSELTSVTKDKMHGDITFNGIPSDGLNVSDLSVYSSAHDEHIPTLTTKETITFAQACNTRITTNDSSKDEMSKTEAADTVEGILELMGLTGASNTIVGNDLLRGVSGGQKRRITLAEMAAFGDPSISLLDEFTTGLDAKVAIELTQHIRALTDVLGMTTIAALLQPPPEVWEMFDRLILMDAGRVVYSGTMDNFLPYMQRIGYQCPPRMDIADFCQEVTTSEGKRYMIDQSPGAADHELSHFEIEFKNSPECQQLEHDTTEGLPELSVIMRAHAKTKPSTVGKVMSVIGRQLKISARDKAFNMVRIFQSLAMGFIVGTLFYQLGNDFSYVSTRIGLLFLVLLFMTLTTFSTIPVTQELREVIYKQTNRATNWYPIWAHVVAASFMEWLWSVVQVLLFGLPVYFLAGLATEVMAVVWFFIVVIVTAALFAQVFMFIAAATHDEVVASTVAGFLVFITQISSGFAIAKASMPAFWEGIYWANPISWSLRALAINEFTSGTDAYDMVMPDTGIRAGDFYLESYGFQTDKSYIPFGILVILVEYFILLALTVLAYRFIRYDDKPPAAIKKSEVDGQSNPVVSKNSSGVDLESGGDILLEDNTHSHADVGHDFKPMTVAFRDLCYTVPIKPNKEAKKLPKEERITSKQLLFDSHGVFRPGRMTALMGASGAGKTTLMDVLAGRKTAGTTTGEIFVNGQNIVTNKAARDHFNRHIGYVEQTDLHTETNTVQETLTFSAGLRLQPDSNMSRKEQVQSVVQQTMTTLNLHELRNIRIKQLTSEQLKRVTIAVEMVANPSVLFLDEPTSGLDALAAKRVVEAIQNVANTGRTVVCTIHQPNIDLFESFDDLVLLQTGGRMAYCGPLGHESTTLINYLQEASSHIDIGMTLPGIRPRENPATYMLNLLSITFSQNMSPTSSDHITTFTGYYDISSLKSENAAQINHVMEETSSNAGGVDAAHSERPIRYNAPKQTQWKMVFIRTMKRLIRSGEYTVSRLVVTILIALTFGSIYYKTRDSLTTSLDVYSRMTLLFFSISYMGVIQSMLAIPFIGEERAVYYRERASRMYSSGAFLMSYVISEIPFVLINSLVFVNIFYWICGLEATWDAYIWFFVFFTLYCFFNLYLGQLFAWGLPNAQIANVVQGLVMATNLNFCGFLIPKNQMPAAWRFLYWLSPMHYALEGATTSQFLRNNDVIFIGSGADTSQQSTVAAFTNSFYQGAWSRDHLGYDLGVSIAFSFVAIIGSYLSLKFVNHMKR